MILYMNAISTLITIQQCYAKTSAKSLLRGVFIESPWRARAFAWVGLVVVPFAPILMERLLKEMSAEVSVISVAVAYCVAVWIGIWTIRQALDQRYVQEWSQCGVALDAGDAKRIYLRYAIFSWHLNEIRMPRAELQRVVECLRFSPRRTAGDFSKFGYIPALAGAGVSAILGFSTQGGPGGGATSLGIISFLLLAGFVSHQVLRATFESDAELRLFAEWYLLERQ